MDAGTRKPLELQVVVPVEDMARLGEVLPMDEQPGGPVLGGEMRTSIWPAIHPRILELIREHRSTIVFTNSRRLAERLAQRLNELAGEELVRAHHGSIAREQRLEIEEELKAGRLPGPRRDQLASSSASTWAPSTSSSRSRARRRSPAASSASAGPDTRWASRARASSSPSTAATCSRPRSSSGACATGAIEPTVLPRNPLDVLAQQIVAMTLAERFTVDELLAIVRRAAPFETLTREALEGVLGMLARRLPVGRVRGAQAADHLGPPDRRGRGRGATPASWRSPAAARSRTAACTRSSSRARPARRAGASASSTRRWSTSCAPGCTATSIVLGRVSSWRVADITPNRVIVTPAPGVPGKLPFWHGDAVGRPVELGRAIGAFVREVEADLAKGPKGRARAAERLRRDHDLDELAAENLLAYLEDEREATGALPTDRRIVVERFRDELGDWRLVILTPFGGRVHAPWTHGDRGAARRSAWASRSRRSGPTTASRSGCPRATATLDGVEELLFPDPDEVEDLVVGRVGQSSLFASRFRENAARALLLPRRRPGTRTPLWQQRQRAADLLAVASRYGSFPILVETYRECLADVFDLPALREILGGVAAARASPSTPWRPRGPRRSRARSCSTTSPPTCTRATRRWPSAARRRSPWTATCCASCWARRSCASCSTRTRSRTSSSASRRSSRSGRRRPRTRSTTCCGGWATSRPDEAGARTAGGRVEAALHLAELAASRRAVRARIAGEERWIAIEDVGAVPRRRGRVARRPACRQAFLAPVAGRARRAAGAVRADARPVPGPEPARRWGLPGGRRGGRAPPAGRRGHRCSPGEFRPGGAEREYCDPEVLRLAAPALAGARSGARWSRSSRSRWRGSCPRGTAWPRRRRRRASAGRPFRGDAALERLAEVVDQLAGLPIPASVLERDVLPGPHPGLPAAPARRAGRDGRGRLGGAGEPGPRRRPRGAATGRAARLLRPDGPAGGRGAAGGRRPRAAPGAPRAGAAPASTASSTTAAGGRTDREVLDALWDLVWAGEVTNDTVAPLRALRWKRPAKDHRPRPGRLTALGPPEAAGRWSLVEAPADAGTDGGAGR